MFVRAFPSGAMVATPDPLLDITSYSLVRLASVRVLVESCVYRWPGRGVDARAGRSLKSRENAGKFWKFGAAGLFVRGALAATRQNRSVESSVA